MLYCKLSDGVNLTLRCRCACDYAALKLVERYCYFWQRCTY
jgi:hypothetical protein